MSTKLGLFCEKLIEAGWLMAAILAPLYFNVYSNRVFEPDKLSLIRSIAVICAAAWLVRWLDQSPLFRAATPANGTPPTNQPSPPVNWLSLWGRYPLVFAATILSLVYLVATIFSVTQSVSIWGSYQRLQGTYTTLSYIVIGLMIANLLRSREQVERLVTVILVTSLPVSLYGLVQHFKLEFLPWGGDVTSRVASSMGNAIFVAAYLVMAAPLALGRWVESAERLVRQPATGDKPATLQIQALVLSVLQSAGLFLLVYQALNLYAATRPQAAPATTLDWALVPVAFILLLLPLFLDPARTAIYLEGTAYGFLLLTQLTAIIFSGSRGPWLGLTLGIVIFVIIYALRRNLRWLWAGTIALGVAGFIFLLAFNLPDTPLAPLHQIPYVGRLGQLMETEGGTGKVRILIWEGAIKLIKDDPFRTLIGYGPEAMYVAYNKFYPPDLAHYEARNASPDRSHNETYDSLVITGLIGFAAYWLVFYSFFYYCLKLLGMIDPRHGREVFGTMMGAGVFAFLLLYFEILPITLSPALPLLGLAVLVVYLFIYAVFLAPRQEAQPELTAETGEAGKESEARAPGKADQPYLVLLIALLAASVAHFFEIQFGIAIASTRTTFWLYAGLLSALGVILLGRRPAAATAPTAKSEAATAKTAGITTRKARKGVKTETPTRPAHRPAGPIWWSTPVAYSLSGALVLSTMAFDFVVPNQGFTPIIAALLVGVWFFVALLLLLRVRRLPPVGSLHAWFASFLVFTIIPWALLALFAVIRSLQLAPLALGGLVDPGDLVTAFYLWLLFLGIILAIGLYLGDASKPVKATGGILAPIVAPILLVITLLFCQGSNLNIVLADIAYKQGDAYDKAGRYDGSIEAYERALNLAPDQDFYYLFLGRAYLELAKKAAVKGGPFPATPTLQQLLSVRRDQVLRMSKEELIAYSLSALEQARRLNPLNTDHTANLGRLYRFWGEMIDRSKLDVSLKYYEEALKLSPNAAHLYDEWGLVYFLKGDFDAALAKYEYARQIDPIFFQTYLYLGDLYSTLAGQATTPTLKAEWTAKANEAYAEAGRLDAGAQVQIMHAQARNLFNQAQNTQDPTQRQQLYVQAMETYQAVLRADNNNAEAHSTLGYIYAQLGRLEEAIQENREVVRLVPTDLNSWRNLAILYQQVGRIDDAITAVQNALRLAPNDATLKQYLDQLQQLKKK